MEKPDSVADSLMSAIYKTLTDGKQNFSNEPERDRFITWCLPGIPINPDDLRFARVGMVGEGADDAARARDTALLATQAANFFRLVDFIPEVNGQRTVAFQPGGKSLSSTYEAALRASKIADTPLTDDEKKRLDEARKALYVEQEVTDPDTHVTAVIPTDGPKMLAYRKHQAIFEHAFFEYNARRIKAEVAASAADVLDFQQNGAAYEKRVTTALRDWEVAGSKEEVERLQATIAQITGRSLVGWKQRLLDRLVLQRKSHPTGDFFLTSIVPASFLQPQAGWPGFSFTESEVQKFSNANSTQYGGKASFVGSFKIGGGADRLTQSKTATENTTNFSISFEIAQIPLSLPYLDVAFLESRAWKFAEDAIDVTALSDGGSPPKGMLIGYPTMVIFVRNVVVNFKELHDENSEFHKTLTAGGNLSIGVISAGGQYKNSSDETKSLSTMKEDGLHINGMQIIGFRCRLLNRAPDPHPGITSFV